MSKFFAVLVAVVLVAGGTFLGEDPVLETPDSVATSVKQQVHAEERERNALAALNAAK